MFKFICTCKFKKGAEKDDRAILARSYILDILIYVIFLAFITFGKQ